MKTLPSNLVSRHGKRIAQVCLAVFMVSFSLPAEEMKIESKALVRAVRGSGEYSSDGQKWTKAKVNMKLAAGSTLRTRKGSTIDLFLGDNGPVVRLGEDSELRIETLSQRNRDEEKVTDTKLELRSGRVMGMVRKAPVDSRYTVHFPKGIANISEMEASQTQFNIRADGYVRSTAGALEVIYQREETNLAPVVVRADQFVTCPKLPGASPRVRKSRLR